MIEMRNVQEKETETIRARKFELKLSDADVERLFFKSAALGVTPEELLENFIGDLVDGTYTNGSDERMFVEQWVDRCFCMNESSSFLKYLLNEFGEYAIEEIYELLDDMDSYNKELNHLLSQKSDDISRIKMCKEDLEGCEEELKEYEKYYEEYKKLNSDGSFEDEIMHIVGWYKKMKKISSEE